MGSSERSTGGRSGSPLPQFVQIPVGIRSAGAAGSAPDPHERRTAPLNAHGSRTLIWNAFWAPAFAKLPKSESPCVKCSNSAGAPASAASQPSAPPPESCAATMRIWLRSGKSWPMNGLPFSWRILNRTWIPKRSVSALRPERPALSHPVELPLFEAVAASRASVALRPETRANCAAAIRGGGAGAGQPHRFP